MMEKSEIFKEIKRIELENKIKVLFLIESGSRAWNFESKDSDYDIRGVYVNEDYYKIDDLAEQLDRSKGKLDICLWDLKKFLKLMYKSNPSVWEWLSSEIIYKDSELRKKLKGIFEKSFNKDSLMKHYASMARQNFQKYISAVKIGGSVNLKKYIYILRSIACVLWIEKYGCPPPKNYKKVINLLRKDVGIFLEKIIKRKKDSEDTKGKRDKEIEGYIIHFFEKNYEKSGNRFDLEELNEIFKNEILKLKNNGIRISGAN